MRDKVIEVLLGLIVVEDATVAEQDQKKTPIEERKDGLENSHGLTQESSVSKCAKCKAGKLKTMNSRTKCC
jgi:hypothetical protein